MYKYVGTDEQLIELGFENHDIWAMWQTNDELCHYSGIDIKHETKEAIFTIGNGDFIPHEVVKLFCDMKDMGLIIWDEKEN